MRRHALSLVVLLVASGTTLADPITDAADKVLAAFRSEDEKALKALAEKEDPDPWLVADNLLERRKFEAAEAFAKAAPRPNTDKLPAYVATRRVSPADPGDRQSLNDAVEAIQNGDPAAVLKALAGVKPTADASLHVTALHLRGMAFRRLRRFEESIQAFEAATEAAERLGWLARAAQSLHRGGSAALTYSDYAAALRLWERQLKLEGRRGNRQGEATTQGNLGIVYRAVGSIEKALAAQEGARRLAVELGDRNGQARALVNLGVLYVDQSKYGKALEYMEGSLRLFEELGDGSRHLAVLGNIGALHVARGDYARALPRLERHRELVVARGDRASEAVALKNIGAVHYALGDYARALFCFEHALELQTDLKDREGVSFTLGQIGAVYEAVADLERALDYYERSLALAESLGSPSSVATTLGNLGNVHRRLGNFPQALDCYERASELYGKLKDRVGSAMMLGNIGVVHERLENYEKALPLLERARELKAGLGDHDGAAKSLINIGNVHYALEDHDKAERCFAEALSIAEERGRTEIQVWSLHGLAITLNAQGRYEEAVGVVRRAVRRMTPLVGKLPETQGATARAELSLVFRAGVEAAFALDDPAEAVHFIESGRAGTLLESLMAREALQAASLPRELADAVLAANRREARAWATLRRAMAAGSRDAIKAGKPEVDAAREEKEAVVERIQREAKRAASVLYPVADSLEEIRGRLGKGEALLLYQFLSPELVAVVVTREGARLVRLGGAREAAADCSALGLDTSSGDPAPVVSGLRKRILEPLRLGPGVTRLLVSPDGALSYLPFGLLAGDREVVLVPSGTTWGVLLEEHERRGEGVLALGDPSIGGRGLASLPGTREEAKAVGTTVLFGEAATEAGLRAALAKRPRWRAAHLACHGLVDAGKPVMSSLALTPEGSDDGYLTVLDVCRMRVPADLAVLSACETAKGKIYRAEGIVGLTRAFMMAGAPRVIVSLWKVDDEATRALMVKFYALWNPKEGSKGLPTATALKKAQEYVRDHPDHPEWKHPYYWAAWQLWGLPD